MIDLRSVIAMINEKQSYTNQELYQLLIACHKETNKTFTKIAEECGLNRQQLNNFKMYYNKMPCQTANAKLNFFFGKQPKIKTISNHPLILDISNQIINNWKIIKLDEQKSKEKNTILLDL